MTITREQAKIISENLQVINAETIADYEQRTGKILQPAHIERSILQTFAYRELLVRKGMNAAFLQQFPQFATGVSLDLIGEGFGAFRLENQSAICTVRFSIDDAHTLVIIPKGTLIGGADVDFKTTIDVTIKSTESFVDVIAECVEVGEVGNGWEIGRLNQVKTSLLWPLSVTNLDEAYGGFITESDDDYRRRVLLAPEAYTTCGTPGAVKFHIYSVSPYVSDISYQALDGGVAEFTILTKDGIPTSSLLSQISDYLDDEQRRGLCASFSIQSPAVVDYDVVATLDLIEGYLDYDVTQRAEKALRDYYSDRSTKLGADIVPLDILAALKVEGVYNVTLTSPALTKISQSEYGLLGSISLTVNEDREDG